MRLLFFCQKTLFCLCNNTNPNEEIARKALGHSPAGLLGFSHMFGGYAGGQAQYLRVPFADVGPVKIPNGIADEKVLFLSDIFPTGYMAAENAEIEPGDTVAIWGCGPVAQFAIQSAWMLGAARVIAIDRVPERLQMAQQYGKAETINFSEMDGMNKGVTIKTGQTHVPRYYETLLNKIEGGEIDPSFVITHRRPLEDGPNLYKTFRDKEEGCIKVVLNPWETTPWV